ncbi:hypothetical protein CEXT_10251 [Caerostris extrusa]|uniref:Uncharacterized protein n=1 Tax=Caerostris extrusa TaxID=172846 RepID=A0AAV4NIX7_CAEEX|nr:hypothetical protein CEXT_10251 [Caerostris extrusa]
MDLALLSPSNHIFSLGGYTDLNDHQIDSRQNYDSLSSKTVFQHWKPCPLRFDLIWKGADCKHYASKLLKLAERKMLSFLNANLSETLHVTKDNLPSTVLTATSIFSEHGGLMTAVVCASKITTFDNRIWRLGKLVNAISITRSEVLLELCASQPFKRRGRKSVTLKGVARV